MDTTPPTTPRQNVPTQTHTFNDTPEKMETNATYKHGLTSPSTSVPSTPEKRIKSPRFCKSSPKSPCRFIAQRKELDPALINFYLSSEASSKETVDCSSTLGSQNYRSTLGEKLLNVSDISKKPQKILNFHESSASPPSTHFEVHRRSDSTSDLSKRLCTRVISTTPEKILDAPDLVDDYYLNLISWSCNDVLAVALGTSVYLWASETGRIETLMCTNDPVGQNVITSVLWLADGTTLAVGTSRAELLIYDTTTLKQIRSLTGHCGRVAALSHNTVLLSSGGRDNRIIHHDLKAPRTVETLLGHTQEVCGLRWSPDGRQLASGGNDNRLNIYDNTRRNPRFSFEHHEAAVKALAWAPFCNSLLASGGGSSDRKIRFWNTLNGTCLNAIDTLSQVCAIEWSHHSRELVSSHGYTQNQLILWHYHSGGRASKIAELNGHTARVLHMTQSPDGCSIVTAAADETLRFWRLFDDGSSTMRMKEGGAPRGLFQGIHQIR